MPPSASLTSSSQKARRPAHTLRTTQEAQIREGRPRAEMSYNLWGARGSGQGGGPGLPRTTLLTHLHK